MVTQRVPDCRCSGTPRPGRAGRKRPAGAQDGAGRTQRRGQSEIAGRTGATVTVLDSTWRAVAGDHEQCAAAPCRSAGPGCAGCRRPWRRLGVADGLPGRADGLLQQHGTTDPHGVSPPWRVTTSWPSTALGEAPMVRVALARSRGQRGCDRSSQRLSRVSDRHQPLAHVPPLAPDPRAGADRHRTRASGELAEREAQRTGDVAPGDVLGRVAVAAGHGLGQVGVLVAGQLRRRRRCRRRRCAG